MDLLIIIYLLSSLFLLIGGSFYHVALDKKDLSMSDLIWSAFISVTPILGTVFALYLLVLIFSKYYDKLGFKDIILIKAKKND